MNPFKLLPLCLLFVSINAFAENVPYRIECLSAGGYYGNIRADKYASGEWEIVAQQGFSHEIATRLGVPESDRWDSLRISFQARECRFDGNSQDVLRCQARTLVVPSHFDRTKPVRAFGADARVRLTRTQTGFSILVSLQIPEVRRPASATVQFAPAASDRSEGCAFRF
jgi:hypothetical protein